MPSQHRRLEPLGAKESTPFTSARSHASRPAAPSRSTRPGARCLALFIILCILGCGEEKPVRTHTAPPDAIEHPPTTAAQPDPASTDAFRLTWTTPADWAAAPPARPRIATLIAPVPLAAPSDQTPTTQPGEPTATQPAEPSPQPRLEIAVTRFANYLGRPEGDVARWLNIMGVTQPAAEHIRDPRMLELPGGAGIRFDLFGPAVENPDQRLRMIAARIDAREAPVTWFVLVRGPQSQVNRLEPAYDAFLSSLAVVRDEPEDQPEADQPTPAPTD